MQKVVLWHSAPVDINYKYARGKPCIHLFPEERASSRCAWTTPLSVIILPGKDGKQEGYVRAARRAAAYVQWPMTAVRLYGLWGAR